MSNYPYNTKPFSTNSLQRVLQDFRLQRISIGENLILRIIINFISIHSYTFRCFLKFYASGRGTTYYTQQVLHNPAASAMTLAASLQSGFVWGRQNRTRRSVCGRINHGEECGNLSLIHNSQVNNRQIIAHSRATVSVTVIAEPITQLS